MSAADRNGQEPWEGVLRDYLLTGVAFHHRPEGAYVLGSGRAAANVEL